MNSHALAKPLLERDPTELKFMLKLDDGTTRQVDFEHLVLFDTNGQSVVSLSCPFELESNITPPPTDTELQQALLVKHGWEMECESPLEVRNLSTGCFASGQAAKFVIDALHEMEV